MDIVALAAKERVRRDMHFDQSIARRAAAEPRRSLALEPQYLILLDARRDRDIEPFLRRQRDPLPAAGRRFDKVDRQRELPVRSGHCEPPAGTPRAAGPPATSEHREQILEVLGVYFAMRLVLPALRALGVRAIGIARPFGAGFVDFAAVVTPPLLGIRRDVVGRRDGLETRFGFRLAGVEIGV